MASSSSSQPTCAIKYWPRPLGAITQKYGRALSITLQFFQVQKSGKLVDNKIGWRRDSALSDGSEDGLDLSKGMYDVGDHIKFGFLMAFSETVLSWANLEYGDRMSAVKELDSAKRIPTHARLRFNCCC